MFKDFQVTLPSELLMAPPIQAYEYLYLAEAHTDSLWQFHQQ